MITLKIEGTASHYGGHCSFWVSTDDDTFTKFADVKDCTLHPDTTQIRLPDWLPTQCETKCTFAWTWTPTVSGLCEVYSNCADIRVTGLSGATNPNPITKRFQDIIDDTEAGSGPQKCVRVEYVFHLLSLLVFSYKRYFKVILSICVLILVYIRIASRSD